MLHKGVSGIYEGLGENWRQKVSRLFRGVRCQK
jgi:hypothetical protein